MKVRTRSIEDVALAELTADICDSELQALQTKALDVVQSEIPTRPEPDDCRCRSHIPVQCCAKG